MRSRKRAGLQTKGEPWARIAVASILVHFFFTACPQGADALYLDAEKTIRLAGKAQTRASIRLNDSRGFTRPNVHAGDLVQHRNLLYIELDHDLQNLIHKADFLKPLDCAGFWVTYRLVGRVLYEGVYDYGPRVFRELQDMNRSEIEGFKTSSELWEGYGDLSRGPLFLRVGRQILAWGETDVFRLLDMINPLDNTYGGFFEDLDDRRIPLLMLRGSYNLGRVGPLESLTLESFWVPGFWENRVSPLAPDGTPYTIPAPPSAFEVREVKPPRKMEGSRWGFRLMGMLGSLNFSAVHYRTFMDSPTPRIAMDLPDVFVELIHEDVQITGTSLNYWERFTDIVFRTEVAWFWDEAVIIPASNLQPVTPTGGVVPRKDILRYMIGLDKQVWIRPLNRNQTFLLSMQCFGQWVPDYEDGMVLGVPKESDPLETVTIEENEHMFTVLMATSYWKGRINPAVSVGYDVRGAWLIQSSVNLVHEPFRFAIQYNAVEGAFTGIGIYRDRDQLSFVLTILLN